MSQRKLKKGIEEQKSATLNKIANIISGKATIQKYSFWSDADGHQWYSLEHCKFLAIKNVMLEHEIKIKHLKNKYKCAT